MTGEDSGKQALALGTVTVPARFEGPPGSANGGWIAGALASFLDGVDVAGPGWSAEAVLRARTPLDTPLTVVPTEGGVQLLAGETLLVEAHPAEPAASSTIPPFVGLDAALEATAAFNSGDAHPFPRCFGCGSGRAQGDGLRIMAGQVPGAPAGLVAAPWAVDTSLTGPEGTIGAYLLWSALDCPSFWAHRAAMAGEDLAALLARQTVTFARGPLPGQVTPGQTCVVVARADAVDGRKLSASSALYDEAGTLIASATSLWIRIPAVTRHG